MRHITNLAAGQPVEDRQKNTNSPDSSGMARTSLSIGLWEKETQQARGTGVAISPSFSILLLHFSRAKQFSLFDSGLFLRL
jgi:hypothetical protein